MMASPGCIRHDYLFAGSESIATEKLFILPWQKTYTYDGLFINQSHHRLALSRLHEGESRINIGIDGFLLLADALKLYELAYFCVGNIIELGTFRGLSTSIMAEAGVDSGRKFVIDTVDINPEYSADAKRGMVSRHAPGREAVQFHTGDAAAFLRDASAEGRIYGFAFIDHCHEYQAVHDACARLHHVLAPGAFALFHDYTDPRNAHPDYPSYDVYQGVRDGLLTARFEFWGIYGCCGLFRLTQ
jgi:predicted O-methyltransferase YrrM